MRVFPVIVALNKRARHRPQLVGAGEKPWWYSTRYDNLSDSPSRVAGGGTPCSLRCWIFLRFELDLRCFGQHAVLRTALNGVGLIWVTGGNVLVLREAIRRSGLQDFIGEQLRSEAVAYGGYSAGACVAGPTLRGLETVDDATAVNEPIWRVSDLSNCSHCSALPLETTPNLSRSRRSSGTSRPPHPISAAARWSSASHQRRQVASRGVAAGVARRRRAGAGPLSARVSLWIGADRAGPAHTACEAVELLRCRYPPSTTWSAPAAARTCGIGEPAVQPERPRGAISPRAARTNSRSRLIDDGEPSAPRPSRAPLRGSFAGPDGRP